MEEALSGKRLLIVGASSGIGRAVGEAAMAAGAEVVLAARRVDALEEIVGRCGRGHAVRIDVRDHASIEAGVTAAVERLGGLDQVLYSAGMSPLGHVAAADAEEWRTVMETNVIGAALTIGAVAPHLAGHGIAAFCSSIDSQRTRPGLALYGASKCALNNLVETARVEHPDVRFLNVLIGPTGDTEFADAFDRELFGSLIGEWMTQGFMTANVMDLGELARSIVTLLGMLTANPTVDLRMARFDPVGGLATPALTSEAVGGAFTPQ